MHERPMPGLPVKDFILDPSGLLIWLDEKLAVVADLHLEKASFYAGLSGRFLPPYDSCETLSHLEGALSSHKNVERLVFLGDSFHDMQAYERLPPDCKTKLDSLADQYECIWITGNHDPGLPPPGMRALEEWHCSDVAFRHIAEIGTGPEISGHYHPCATVKHKSGRVRRKCFAVGNRKLIMPSFGALTGGLCLTDPVFAPLLGSFYDAYLLGTERVYHIAHDRLIA